MHKQNQTILAFVNVQACSLVIHVMGTQSPW